MGLPIGQHATPPCRRSPHGDRGPARESSRIPPHHTPTTTIPQGHNPDRKTILVHQIARIISRVGRRSPCGDRGMLGCRDFTYGPAHRLLKRGPASAGRNLICENSFCGRGCVPPRIRGVQSDLRNFLCGQGVCSAPNPRRNPIRWHANVAEPRPYGTIPHSPFPIPHSQFPSNVLFPEFFC